MIDYSSEKKMRKWFEIIDYPTVNVNNFFKKVAG